MMTAHSTQQTTQQTAHYTHDRWHGCYGRGWGGELVKEAFAHPAKVSFTLAQRIYQHALEAGFIGRGGTVLDPFGGVGGFAYGALFAGLHWVGVELEEKFVGLGRANIAMWCERYEATMPRWGRATLLQGDSRKLLDVVGQADLVVSSPPYCETSIRNDADFSEQKISERIKSGKSLDRARWGNNKGSSGQLGYGAAHGQLGAMAPGNLDMVISSPPFGEAQSGGGLKHDERFKGAGYQLDKQATVSENLAALPTGAFDAVVGSPPFEDSVPQQKKNFTMPHDTTGAVKSGYGTTNGNVGNATGETFWAAARQIVEQCYLALKPGGHAIWVTKRYVKGGRIVEFTDQWVRLCESVGFVMRCHHHAMLVQDSGAQGDLFGGVQVKRKERKSFFRRLAERKGSPRIDWEDVVCMIKPTQFAPDATQAIASNCAQVVDLQA